MRVSAPPFVKPCYYGTDIDDEEKLIANHHSVEEIAQIIGVDSLGFLSREGVTRIPENTSGFCAACFTGDYPCEPPKNPGKSKFERKISEGKES